MAHRIPVDLARRAARHAALGEPVRLAIAEDLAVSDRTASELGARFGLPSNLLAHHLGVMERAGLVQRSVSSGDRRRRYLRLAPGAGTGLGIGGRPLPDGRVVFVCTHNSARSQLAAAAWADRTGGIATSAGTHPATRVHPGAVAAARRAGLDLADARPRELAPEDLAAELLITVCDRAHEELAGGPDRLHWSVPDPAEVGTRAAFDGALREIDRRIRSMTTAA